jgi:UPF0176 protein
MFRIAAFYKFIPLSPERIGELHDQLLCAAAAEEVVGLVLLGREGINATVAGTPAGVLSFMAVVKRASEFENIDWKESWSERRPFRRFKIDRRAEIVTLKKNVPSPPAESYLSPLEWHARLARGEPVTVLDVRNRYETELGVFAGAVTLPIERFSDLPGAIAGAALPRERPVLMYCTGGIRCEKALGELKGQGFREVFQLHGGILKYLEEFPEGHFRGECFVFDHRVAVDSKLKPTERYALCPHCGDPGEERAICRECGQNVVLCRRCGADEYRLACSKNCAYHLRRRSTLTRGA